jgi:hypothetical protein
MGAAFRMNLPGQGVILPGAPRPGLNNGKENIMKRAVFVVAAATLLTWGASASASNGMVVTTLVVPGQPVLVECLGEEINGVTEVTVYGHFLQTPSGVVHYIDNWKMKSTIVGQTTGRIWVGKGFSPWVENGVAGEKGVTNIRTSIHSKPFNDNGQYASFPDLRYAWRAKLTVNANGEVTVFVPPPMTPEEVGDIYKCIGPGY